MSILVNATNLVKRYGMVTAVDNVNITINSGAIVGLVGRNGAGKTTLIRILTGLAKQTSGSFEILPQQERADTSVAAIVEKPSVYLNMNGMDNLKTQSLLLGLPVDENYLQTTLQLVGLDPNNKAKAKNYSLGMRQRLAIAMTLVGKPKLLLLDEPTNGLDPEGIHDMRELFVKLNKQFGTTILVSSHILTELGKFATEFYFMEQGKIIKHATAEEIQQSSQKRLRVTVDDKQRAMEVLADMQVKDCGENVVEIFGDVPATQVLLVLAQNNVVATNILPIGEDLESYYISLLQENQFGGGITND